jgi:hypothetical protein
MRRNFVSVSGTQEGVLRKKSLGRAANIADHRLAEIEYEDAGNAVSAINPATGRGGVVIVNVTVRDGQPVEDGDYIFIVKGAGFFEKDHEIVLTHQGGRWANV